MQNFGLDIRDKVLLFDFDGTLVETEYLAQRVIEQYFLDQNYRYQAPKELIIGRTWQAAIESMGEHAKSFGVELASPEVLHDEFKRRYHEAIQDGVKLIPGFLECLPFFKEQAKFMGIVTGSDHKEVQTALKVHDLARYFDRIWAYGDYEHSKPDPSPYLTAMKEIQAQPEEVIVFEDSVAGMESASRAGVSFIQICHEAHAKQGDVRALRVIQNWNDLLKK